MTSKKYLVFTPRTALPPAPTAGKTTSPKCSLPSDVNFIVSDPSGLDPTTAHTHTTDEFQNVVNNIVEAIPYLTASMSYDPETVLLKLVELRQEFKVSASI